MARARQGSGTGFSRSGNARSETAALSRVNLDARSGCATHGDSRFCARERASRRPSHLHWGAAPTRRRFATNLVARLHQLIGEFSHARSLALNYRGDVIPAFALQAFLSWARIAMSEVQIQIGSHIALPGGRRIPIDWDGSLTVNPNASKLGRRFSLNELLLLAQQRQNSPLQSL